MPKDLFDPVIDADRHHPQFRDLRNSEAHAPARMLMNALFERMGDPDRNFRPDFQGVGFHARVFELCCYAYLEAAGLKIDRSHPYPDFLVNANGVDIAVEVVTSNPTDGANLDVSAGQLTPLSDEEMYAKAETEFPRRMLRSLSKKVRKNYQRHTHVTGRPIVLMIAPFHEPGSNFYIEDLLLPALYPLADNGSDPPLFVRKEATHISAVAFCNTFTVSKLWRMADPAFIAANFVAQRHGHALFEEKDGLFEFHYQIGHPATPAETWFEGVGLSVNPHASVPLPVGALPASSTTVAVGDQLERYIRGFHPLASTFVVEKRSAD